MSEIKLDKKWVGIPFKWQGRDFDGMDCVGLVYKFLQEHGVNPLVPDNDGREYGDDWHKENQRFIEALNKTGKKIPPDIGRLRPYDVVCFQYRGKISHIGVYLGYGKFLHISKTSNSAVGRLNSAWQQFFVGAIRPTEAVEEKSKAWVLAEAVGDPITAIIATIVSYVAIHTAFTLAVVAVASLVAVSYFMASKPSKPSFGATGNAEGSQRYSFGPLSSTASSDLPVPILYGELKIATNAIYQSDPGEEIKRCDVLSVGEIDTISDIRVNDNAIGDLEGCSVTAYYGTASQTVDSRFSDRVIGLRNVAYLALTLKTSDKLSGGFPTVTAVCKGVKIQTYDSSRWTTTKTYNNNPAACVRDLLLSKRYGLGLSESVLDHDSFGEVYDYCFAYVDDNNGTTERRYELNFMIDVKKPAIDTLNEMLSTFGGYLVWSGGRLRLRCEKVDNVVQNFTMDSIIEKSFTYRYISKDEAINKVKIQYVDPDQNYTKVFALAEDKGLQDEREAIEGCEGVVEKEVEILGITRFSQASRIANQMLKSVKAASIICMFKVGIKGIHCEPGDVVTVSHDVPNWTNKPFRITSIKEEENDEMEITAKEYNDSVYDDGYGSSIANYQYGTPPNALAPPAAPSNVQVSETGAINGSGGWVSTCVVAWTAPTVTDFIQHYFVEASKDGGDYVSVGTTTGVSINLTPAEELASYVFRVRSVNYYGLMSTAALSSAYTVLGKSAPPSDVTGFGVTLSVDVYLFTWTEVTDDDLYGYEIRLGSSWDTGTVIDTGIAGTRYMYKPVTTGTHNFMIKAIDTSGNYSTGTDEDTIVVTTAPDANVLVEEYEWARLGEPDNQEKGTFTGEISFEYTNKYNSAYNRRSMCMRTAQTWGELEATLKTWATVQSDGTKWGEPLVTGTACSYTTAIYDLGSITSAPITLTKTEENEGIATTSEQIRTSFDNVTWTDWEAFTDGGYYNFRYVQMKFTFQISTSTTNYYLSDVIINMDVPDLLATDGGNGVDISAGGTTIYYNRSFTVKPRSLVVSTVDETTNIVPVISEQTAASFKCTLYDKTDTSVEGKINYWARGW